jgi:hypothetical protein
MAKTARKMAMAMVSGAMLATPQASAAADETAAIHAAAYAHVRSSSPAIVSLMQQAMDRSVTFRGLVETIDASDSYVYVNEGECSHGVRACFVSVTLAGTRRIMWVKVDTRKADWDLMGSIGHELRHTIEVISNPSVKDNDAKFFLYEKIGMHGVRGTRETRAAVTAGNTVRSEVRTFNRHAKSE